MADSSSLERIFFAALEMGSPEERAAFLDDACAGEVELRERVEKMLAAQFGAKDFLESPAHCFSATAAEVSNAEGSGSTIGPYKLLEQIGEGGFGVVFMAEQTHPVRRKVALKVLKPGMDTRLVVARFEAERQALAIMDHPNIARVFDGGSTATGRPFFVMELVKGVPITEYCDQNRLTPRERLELFISVCRAVQHAHQKGIIHRDLKPSNVLVSRHDSTPVVKVIDFGVAKALGQELTNKTLFTGIAQMIGTPLYMSPEQAGMSDLDVDTRSDIYSLGVLLYELLTGTTPFTKERFKTAAYDEIWRIIREEEPQKPSTRLSSSKGTLASVSARRHMEPAKLTKLVRGDLDWIVMRALEKDRNRRYETATSLAADVQRYLDDEPVLARSPSPWYRLRKFVRRNKGPALAASLVVLALVGGVVGTTWGMFRADAARDLATNEASQKRRALEEKGVALEDANDQLFQALVNRARAERSSGRIGQRFTALKTIREAAELRVTDELKAEAAAALVLPDFEIAHEWEAISEDTVGLDFDANFERYARLDSKGGIAVCRRSNDREEILTRLPPCGRPPRGSPVMSPDGRFVAFRGIVDTDKPQLGTTFVWSISNYPLTSSPLKLQGEWNESAVAYRSNSRQLAIGYIDGWIGVYDLESGKRIRRIDLGASPYHLAFHPSDGRLAVAVGGAVRIFDVDTGKKSPVFRPEAGFINVCWHPDGRRLALCDFDSKVHLWNAHSASESTLASGQFGYASTVAFNPLGTLLVCRDWDSVSQIRDGRTGRRLIEAPNLGGRFSQDGRLLGWATEGKTVRLWRVADGAELRSLRQRSSNESDGIRNTVLNQNGRVLAACGGKWLGFFDVASGEELASMELAHADTAFPVFFDPPSGVSNGRPDWKSSLSEEDKAGGWVTAGEDGMFHWPARLVPDQPTSLRIGPARFLFDDRSGLVGSAGATASLDGRIMAVPQINSTLLLHRGKSPKRLVLGDGQFDVRFSAVSPDRRWVFTGGHWHDDHYKAAQIWDAETGAHVHDLPLVASCPARFSPNGKWLLANSANGARLFEVETWTELRRLKGYGTFSPDSRLLALQDGVNGILIEETATGRTIARLTSSKLFRNCPGTFTPDGARLILVNGDIWDLRLIRKQLKELDLDWAWPELPPPPESDSSGPMQIEILKGEFESSQIRQLERERKSIEDYQLRFAANPNDATACNGLAWHLLTSAESLRDVKAAVLLAQKAVNSDRGNSLFATTLGVAFYRNARYHDAIVTLRANLSRSENKYLSRDLYFLAMSHHKLGDVNQSRDFLDLANRATRAGLSGSQIDKLNAFRVEAENLFGDKTKNGLEASPPPPPKK